MRLPWQRPTDDADNGSARATPGQAATASEGRHARRNRNAGWDREAGGDRDSDGGRGASREPDVGRARAVGPVPPGRAERLGLVEVDPAASTALAMPHEFLRLGDSRRVGGELAGYIGELGARVFEFHADEFVPDRSGSASGGVSQYAGFPYHVAAVELGYRLPWLAIAPRHVLHADGPGAAAVLDAALLAWLADVLVMRIEQKTLATLEVSHGWALAAVQAHALVRPDAGALAMQAHDPRRPGPWPDTLLGLLRNFRDRVPPAQRLP